MTHPLHSCVMHALASMHQERLSLLVLSVTFHQAWPHCSMDLPGSSTCPYVHIAMRSTTSACGDVYAVPIPALPLAHANMLPCNMLFHPVHLTCRQTVASLLHVTYMLPCNMMFQ